MNGLTNKDLPHREPWTTILNSAKSLQPLPNGLSATKWRKRVSMSNASPPVKLDIKSATLLLVDDEAANLRLLTTVLEQAGYSNIISTQDPREALPLQLEYKCDIILLDLNMPHMDGYEVMEQFNAIFGAHLPPILVLTAQEFQGLRQRAFNTGARDYVTKPFDIPELLSRVSNLIEVKLALDCISEQNETLEQRVRDRTAELIRTQKELQESRLQVVRRLGRASEYRDNETGLHIIRMSEFAALLGKSIGLDQYYCDLILNASPMHDIGKIGIPDAILLKKGKLDAQEWEIMKTHAQIGADILSDADSDLLIMAAEIAITHHEKWDGSGYPKGLSGEDIPISGRITAIADVFDALTSERPYKHAWSVADAVNLIEEESGHHFDPFLVEHFLKILPDIVELKEMYAEPDVNHSSSPVPK